MNRNQQSKSKNEQKNSNDEEDEVGQEEDDDEEIINKYTEKMSKYTVTDLEKDLAFELVQSNPTIFTIKDGNGRIPKDEPKTGIEAILEQYRK